jgi:hypothetical protein
MKIKYVYSSDPGVEKSYDTEKSLQGCIGLIHALGGEKTQGEWDKEELARFERDRQKGYVLSYSVCEPTGGMNHGKI